MSSDFDYLDESEAPVTAMGEVMEAVNALKNQRAIIAEMEEQLAEAKKMEEEMSMVVVPQMLDNHGVASIKLDNGVEVSVKEDVRASVPKDITRKANGLKWLSEQGAGSLVKDVVSIEDPDEALVTYLEDHGISYGREKDVDAKSLAAWFREKFGIKKGSVASMELAEVSPDISCFRYRKTTIK